MANRATLLPSAGEVVRNDLALSLLNAPSGLVQKVDMSSSGKTGVVKNLEAVFDSRTGSNFISWQFTGDITNTAYFVVMASYNGVKAPVGTTIPDGRTANEVISYADKDLGGALGVIAYSVIPVGITGELLTESAIKSVKNLSTFPLQALLRT